MNIFFAPGVSSGQYLLTENESRHCVRVLRLGKGDEIILVDGAGGYYKAEITEPDDKKCSVKITGEKKEYGKRNHYLHIACAPTKNIERFEWFLEKAVEIGIDEISPVLCEHAERTSVKAERLNKVIISAMKQSAKAYLPRLNGMIKLEELLEKNFEGQKFIAHCRNSQTPHLKTLLKPRTGVFILIGPEGDFSENEIGLAGENNFLEVSLGASRLRTETAALVACHTVNLLND